MTAALVQELSRLPLEEKLQILDLLWDSVDAREVPVDPLQVNEVRTRLGELKQNPALGISLEELKSRLG